MSNLFSMRNPKSNFLRNMINQVFLSEIYNTSWHHSVIKYKFWFYSFINIWTRFHSPHKYHYFPPLLTHVYNLYLFSILVAPCSRQFFPQYGPSTVSFFFNNSGPFIYQFWTHFPVCCFVGTYYLLHISLIHLERSRLFHWPSLDNVNYRIMYLVKFVFIKFCFVTWKINTLFDLIIYFINNKFYFVALLTVVYSFIWYILVFIKNLPIKYFIFCEQLKK